MQFKYLDTLPACLEQLILKTEQEIGFEINVVVDPRRVSGRPDTTYFPMACKIGSDFASILTNTSTSLRPGSVFHELLHIRRFLVEGVPALVVCEEYEPWTAAIETALAKHDNAFEHLVIVPVELETYPERKEYWEAVALQVLNDIQTGMGDEVAKRQLGLANWAFLHRALPDSTSIPLARSILKSRNEIEHAECFCRKLFPTLKNKIEAIRIWLEYQEVPTEMVSLKYFEPVIRRKFTVPINK